MDGDDRQEDQRLIEDQQQKGQGQHCATEARLVLTKPLQAKIKPMSAYWYHARSAMVQAISGVLQTSTHSAPTSSASRAGARRTALFTSPAAGSTSS